MTKKLLVPAGLLAKSQVAAFTRKDGVMVQSHDNGKQAAAPKPAAGRPAPAPGDVGHEEHQKYGVHFKKGDKVKDRYGKSHEVQSHTGPEVKTASGESFHPTKLFHDAPAADKPTAPSGGYSVEPFKHGGHVIKNAGGKSHIILRDKGVADRHAGALNHVAQSGKDAHMNEAVSATGKKHLHLDSFDEVGSDREDFVDTGKGGLKAALHHAYDAGAGHSKGGAHRDAVVSEAAKHFAHFDSLEQAGRDHEDFKDVGKGSLKHALTHAYASGAQKAQAKPKLKVKAPAAPAHTPNPHHSDLEEGDELLDEKGQKHEYSATHRGIGRMQVEMRSGHKVPTGSDGKLAGWKKTGRNNVTGAGHKPL